MTHPYFEYTDVDRRFFAERIDPLLPERIFDAHRHVQLPEHLDESRERFKREAFPEEIAGPEAVEQARRGYEMMFPGREVHFLGFGSPATNCEAVANNEYVSAELAGTGSAGLALSRPEWSAGRLLEELRRPAIIGIKPYERLLEGFEGGDVSIFEFLPHQHLELLDELQAWVTLHLPRAQRLADRGNIDEILQIRRRYPNVVLVIAHLGRSYAGRYAREGFPPLADDPAILFDNSAVLNPAVHALALDRFGPERILWGSDQPVFYMRGRRRWEGDRYINLTSGDYSWNTDREPPEVEATYTLSLYEAIAACLDTLMGLGFGEAEIEAIFHDNARRLVDEVLGRKESW
ncbi:MAG: amidohydrolase family protein [Armatimonadota bacterium]|nr:amidohydrolase family protein [Armatimonadota bacterium]